MENQKEISKQKNSSPTPYDDVFRTLITDCSRLVIPVLNEAFGEHYTGNEKVELGPNEHFLRQQDGDEQRRITDSSFRVIGEDTKTYLLECQSNADSSMLVRIFEYVTQIALDESETIENRLKLIIPNAAILFLRSTKNTSDTMTIEMCTPGGDVEFNVPCLKVQSYTIDEIFEKRLYFLVPFYIFTYESRFQEINADKEMLNSVMQEYQSICVNLDEAMQIGLLTAFTRKSIMEMSEKVLEALAAKYSNIRKGVKSVMGGTVLDYEAKRILNQGRVEGRAEGRAEGRVEGRIEGELSGKIKTAKNMAAMGMDNAVIAQALDSTESVVKEWIENKTA